MKTSEALLEFLVPGMVFWANIMLAFYPEILFAAGTQSMGGIETGGAALLLGLLIPLGYLTGAFFSEIGTLLISRSTERHIQKLLLKRNSDVEKVKIIRNIDGSYRQFSALRAACRHKSNAICERLKSHESILRMYRPASVVIPMSIFICIARLTFIRYSENGLTISIFLIAISLLLSVFSWIFIKVLFLQRVESCFHSCLNALIAE